MEEEIERYTTFAAFPQSCPITPSQLSAAGFYYEGNEDEVVCPSCGLKYKNWQRGDNPLTLHQQRSPACNVVCNLENPSVEDIYHHNDDEVDRRNCHVNIRSLRPDSEQSREQPHYPFYSHVNERLQSFNRWPSTLTTNPTDLANAGFFYTGTADHVRCFQCRGGLHEWEEDDDPVFEHARHFPSCSFLKRIKTEQPGKKIVKTAVIKHGDLLRSGNNDETDMFDHPAVLTLMEMGYSKTLLAKVIRLFLNCNKMDFCATNLLSVIFEIEDIDMADTDQIDDIPDQEGTNASSDHHTNDIPGDMDELFNHPAVQCVLMAGDYSPEQILEAIAFLKSKPKAEFKARQIMECLLHIEEEAEQRRKDEEIEAKQKQKDEERKMLEAEVEELRRRMICKVCLENDVQMYFRPCGHICVCVVCAMNLQSCPVCRTHVEAKYKAYIS